MVNVLKLRKNYSYSSPKVAGFGKSKNDLKPVTEGDFIWA